MKFVSLVFYYVCNHFIKFVRHDVQTYVPKLTPHFFVLSVPAVMLHKLPIFVDDGNVTTDKKLGVERL